jgi:hypothetical protein
MAGGAINPEKIATPEILDPRQVQGSIPHAATVDFTDNNYTKQLKAAAILSEQANKQPTHRGIVHYLTHSDDFALLAAT